MACTGAGGNVSKSLELVVAPKLWATSYQNYKQIGLTPMPTSAGIHIFYNVRGFGDFFGDGRLDYVTATLDYDGNKPIEQAQPGAIRFYARQENGTYAVDSRVPDLVGCIHPRKALVADFNGDRKADVFVLCHGYDVLPWPGERNRIALSQPNGGYIAQDAAPDIFFSHGGSAADVDGDGDVDVDVLAVGMGDRAPAPVVFLNDGRGNFSRETKSRLPAWLNNDGISSADFVDVNEDGKPDLLIGGMEWAVPTYVFLNPGNFDFSQVQPTVLPAVAGQGCVLDFTVTGTAATRSIWVVRTSCGEGIVPYVGYVVQRINWNTLESTIAASDARADWVDWLIPAIVDGHNVITTDHVRGISIAY